MCRFIAYRGPLLRVSDLLYKPEHSLVNQSYHALEMSEPLNGDGFGLGWYAPQSGEEPAVFVSISPAWNNRNLRYMAPKLVSPCILAHVRAASEGGVSELNCHPFHDGDLLMMHNGGVNGFARIKRPLMDMLSEESFLWIKGETDSERLFALFLDHYRAMERHDVAAMADALEAMFRDLRRLKAGHGVTGVAQLNMVVTDGVQMVASRYADAPHVKPRSLHHSERSTFASDEKGTRMRAAKKHEQAVLIASEPLTRDAEYWNEVPAGHLVLVNRDNQVSFRPICL